MKKLSFRKIVGVLLSLCLVASLFTFVKPMTARADGYVAKLVDASNPGNVIGEQNGYNTLQAAFDEAANQANFTGVVLMQDVVVNEDITLNQNINLFLNGHTLTINSGKTLTGDVSGYKPQIDVMTYTTYPAGSIVSKGNLDCSIELYDSSITISGGTATFVVIYDGTLALSGGTTTFSQIFGGTLTMTGGTLSDLDIDDGTITISGGTVADIDVLNNMGSPTLTIRGTAQIEQMLLEYYGDNGSGTETITITESPRIKSLGFADTSNDTKEGSWGSLTITGGYFRNDPTPSTYPNLAAIAEHITTTFDATKLEQYSGQADWAVDGSVYRYRVNGTLVDESGSGSGSSPSSGGSTESSTDSSSQFRAISIANATVTGVSNKTYTGKAITQKPKVKVSGKTLTLNTDYTLSYKNNTKVGTATMTITGKGNYTGSKNVTFKINKATNPMKLKAKTLSIKAKDVKKKAKTYKISKCITFSQKAQGTVTYVKKSGNGKITVNKKTGKVTVKKGLKKGTYKIKVNVTAAGNSKYKKLTKQVTFTVKVK